MVSILLQRLWNSPTFTTWANLGTQSLSLILILPLLLTQLSPEEVTVYYIFTAILSFHFIFTFGFQPTFVRMIGYALGGLPVSAMADLRELAGQPDPSPPTGRLVNLESLGKVCSSMRFLNRILAVAAFMLLGLIGTLALMRPIGILEDPASAWTAWFVIVTVSSIRIAAGGFSTYLTGSGHIALNQRWETLFNLGAILSLFAVLLILPALFPIILVHQCWILLATLRNWKLAEWVSRGDFSKWSKMPFDRETIRIAWPSSWRSGIGHVCSRATQQSLGILFAQIGPTGAVASYLLGMRIIGAIEQFSMAPFYSKLPAFNRLRAQNRSSELDGLAMKGMRYAHWIYFLGVTGIGFAGPLLLQLIGSNVSFPTNLVWFTLGIGFFFQRHGAMHLQQYSTTNHIIWHWASGLQGLTTVLACLVLGSRWEGLSFALAILLGNVVYAAYSAVHNYRGLSLKPLSFEWRVAIVPLIGLLGAAMLELQFGISGRISEILSPMIR